MSFNLLIHRISFRNYLPHECINYAIHITYLNDNVMIHIFNSQYIYIYIYTNTQTNT